MKYKLYLIPETASGTSDQPGTAILSGKGVSAQSVIDLPLDSFEVDAGVCDSGVMLTEWMTRFADRKERLGRSNAFAVQIRKALRHIELFYGKDIRLADVTADFCRGFIAYLRKSGLSPNSCAGYFRCLNTALNAAVKSGFIPRNPAALLATEDKIRLPDSSREYLTCEEIKRLVDSPCANMEVKRAYLFGCMCALRLSDIKALRWGDLWLDGGQWRAAITMVKTGRRLWLPLSPQAIRWLPPRREAPDNARIFSLPSDSHLNKVLRQWVLDTGINKHITFHTSRHTHATLLLSLGVDLFTVSKLLGHTQVKTTQIYARIIDKTKDDAVNRIPDFSS